MSPTLLPSPPQSLGNLRPKERVQLFFKDYIEKHAGSHEARLPTIKEISKHLEVSAFTVQSVVGQLSKEGKVITTPGKGTYLNIPEKKMEESHPVQPLITVSIHERELMGKDSTWGKEICAGIMHGISGHSEPMMMMRPFFVDIDGSDEKKVNREASYSAGLIVFPSTLNRNLVRAFKEQGKPVIHITSPGEHVHENFVGPDFYSAARAIGDVWLKTPRRHVLLLFHHSIAYGSDPSLSLSGMMAALNPEGNCGNAPKVSYHCLPRYLSVGNFNELREFLDLIYRSPSPPDAIYSTSDTIAIDTANILLERGISIPEEVSIIGGTGLNVPQPLPFPCTLIEQPLEEIGSAAAGMLINAISEGGKAQTGRFLPTRIRIGDTTQALENEQLRLLFQK